MGAISFRRAVPGDAPALGALHVASWRETYAGILPEDMLAALSAESRAAMWERILGDPEAHAGAQVYVAQDGERLVGFGACGEQREETLAGAGFGGEIGAIYVLRSHQHRGIGRAIMSLLAQAHLKADRRGASLWVLRENLAARSFYERLGGTVVGERTEEAPDAILVETAYGWRDLTVLVR